MRGVLMCAALAAMGLTGCKEKVVGAQAAEAVPQAAAKAYDLNAMIIAAKAADEVARAEPVRTHPVVATSFASASADESPAPALAEAPQAALRLTNLRTERGARGAPAPGSIDLYGIGRRNDDRTRRVEEEAARAAVLAAAAAPIVEAVPATVPLVDQAGAVTVLSVSDGSATD